MTLKAILKETEKEILEEWFDCLYTSYDPDTMWRFKNSTDLFHNPVGVNSKKALTNIWKILLDGGTTKEATLAMDPVIRIRAIQKFSPSLAISFLIELKEVVRKVLKKKKVKEYENELYALDSQIDTLQLLAFDVYTSCREEISQLRVDTERKKIYSAFSRAGLLDITDEEKALLEDN